MFDWTSKFSARSFAAVLFAVTVGGALFPATAVASCGDYVMLGAGHPFRSRHPDPSADRVTEETGIPQEDGGRSQTPAPCSGPECGRHRNPLPAAPAGAREVSHEYGFALASAVLAPSHVSTPCRIAAAARPVRRASNIFHPPRSFRGCFSA